MVSWHQRIRDLEEENRLLKRHIAYLESVIRQYINENTPSSQIPPHKKAAPKEDAAKPKKPLGKPRGSAGGTRVPPNIDHEKVVRLDQYESYLGEPIGYVERTVVDLPTLTKAQWTRYLLAQYTDPVTGQIITATDERCPKQGCIGPHLRSLITLLREQCNLSEGKTAGLLQSIFGFDVSAATIEATLASTARLFQPSYNALAQTISTATIKHSDETSQSVNGKQWCCYTFSTQQHTYYFTEPSKRAQHIKDRLIDNGNNVLVCDGHSIYTWYSIKQRCWSHAIRKDRWLLNDKETDERLFLHEGVSGIFERAKNLLKREPPGAHLLEEVLMLRNRMTKIINYAWKDPECEKVANYMKNGWDSWFTFMFVPGVEPTNNLNERDIRKHVMKRKISGCFRTEQGLNDHCILLSMIETWRKNDLDVYQELTNAIKQNNVYSPWQA